ncbi:hypothetical protein AB0I77_26450 [Streptomyces sp. NPDC050619]
MFRLDLAQGPRLLEIEANTRERLEEAHRMQTDRLRWHAEHGEGGTGVLS